ncbi:ISAs1 family transposase [Nodularia sp. NIES-3585]|uniref:ISAs1 family transposase n=1 Tax=Nodularia sp. NIES-3585 TaxID=1973477 RepID=UPI000B5CFA66|nr:ISAs1 family transposase [Nodularia sp. NIES-3585]GAX37349.1 transposase [Nodularia sp. NIES-3585]GAX38326.1 transposase [Nodularia sp. NIES-3585]GAX38409.1 transposase [Nodularia sp. NIES-3585]GAX38967.1 transposase [Nodularia sp. NIES-3585]
MSQGFETKFADAPKNCSGQRKSTQVADIGSIQQSLVGHFADIKDPRVERTKKHQLTDILVIAILAVIAGAQGWEDIENYGISKQKWLEEFLALPNGIPSDDTFRRVFEFIDPEALNRCFLSWVETLVTKTGGEIIPIDGKSIRGSYDRNQGKSALHVISAWSSEQHLVLAQMKVEDKSNEITAIPALLELLDITGSIITIDAMGTQTEIAKKIIDSKADYVLALKANHPTLYHQVEQWFETAVAEDFQGIDVSYDQRIEKGHHRTEIRQVWSARVSALGELYQPKVWAGLQSVVMVVRERRLWNKTTREVQFYLTSLHSDAQLLGRAIRKHWGIENQVHWTLDCTFAEDSCRIRSFHSPRNFALLRRIALNALNREQTYKRSLRQKMKRTGMDNDYMIRVLSSCFIDSTLDSSQPLCQA